MFSLKVVRISAYTALAFLVSSPAMAGVVITGTRLIYPEGQKEVTVKLNNNGLQPALVQAWVDDGDARSSPTNSKAPFILSPPVSRIDPSKGQSLRLMFTGKELPANKESVFWLNVLEIPPKVESTVDTNLLQMAFRSRIKVFYRPNGLVGSVVDAPGSLQWKIVNHGNLYAVQAYNPTAFHVSLAELSLVVDGRRYISESGMIKPNDTQDFSLPDLKSRPNMAGELEFNAINDYGASTLIKYPLKP
jgi:P pilus assembly chaperone PapD